MADCGSVLARSPYNILHLSTTDGQRSGRELDQRCTCTRQRTVNIIDVATAAAADSEVGATVGRLVAPSRSVLTDSCARAPPEVDKLFTGLPPGGVVQPARFAGSVLELDKTARRDERRLVNQTGQNSTKAPRLQTRRRLGCCRPTVLVPSSASGAKPR